MKTVLCIVAHSDDEIVGMGGTILKYLDEGKKVITIIFSYGQKSHPNLKEEVIKKTRVIETKRLDVELNRQSIFLGLTEGNIKEEAEKLKVQSKLAKLIKKYKPEQIFTHTSGDPHPDHKAVNHIITKTIEETKYKGEFLTFEVWNIINENLPMVYIDISPYFKEKLKLTKFYKSQKLSIYPLLIPMIIRAKKYGMKNKCKYAERFYKIR